VQLEQILINLASNARDAMPEGGTLAIETSNERPDAQFLRQHPGVQDGEYVALELADTGTGMDNETISRIFEPFFTTKEPGVGTGMGLSTVYGIVKQSDGHIWVESERARGTTFRIYLPRIHDRFEEPPGEDMPPESATGSETVLLVEDEDGVRKLTRMELEDNGYSVFEARDGEEALAFERAHEGTIHILLTDVLMPGMSGKSLYEEMAARRAGIKVLFVSGHTEDAIVHRGVLEKGTPFLPKPFTPDALVRKVREVLDAPADRRS
jgi:CheY-like chemotaxis protein